MPTTHLQAHVLVVVSMLGWSSKGISNGPFQGRGKKKPSEALRSQHLRWMHRKAPKSRSKKLTEMESSGNCWPQKRSCDGSSSWLADVYAFGRLRKKQVQQKGAQLEANPLILKPDATVAVPRETSTSWFLISTTFEMLRCI